MPADGTGKKIAFSKERRLAQGTVEGKNTGSEIFDWRDIL
jgi:hypothetical protein